MSRERNAGYVRDSSRADALELRHRLVEKGEKRFGSIGDRHRAIRGHRVPDAEAKPAHDRSAPHRLGPREHPTFFPSFVRHRHRFGNAARAHPRAWHRIASDSPTAHDETIAVVRPDTLQDRSTGARP